MSKFMLSAAAVAVAMLSGCAAPGDIQPTNQLNRAEVLSHSSRLAPSQFSAAAWPQTDWWTALNDAQLNDLIARALKSSPTLQLANANLRKASAVVMAADAQFDPQLAVNAGVARSRLSRSEDYSFQGNRYGTISSLGLSGSYHVDLWGGERDSWEASVDAQRAAQVDHQAARISLSSAIASRYIALANAYRLLDIAKQDQQRTQGIVTITQRLLDNGLTSDDRLYTAQSNAASAQLTVKQRRLAIKQLNNALATMVGEGPDVANSIQRPSALMNTALALPAKLPANLLAHRPDIVAAKWRVEAASKNIAAAKTRFYPNLNLTAMAGFRSLLGDAMFDDVSRQWRVAPAISLPIFTKDLQANLIEHTADYDAAVAQYNQILVSALGDVANTVLALQSASQQLNDAQRSVTLATKSYHITEQRYQSGMGSQLEVLMAENQLLQAESALTTLQNQQQAQQVTLVSVLGGGFYDAPATHSAAEPAPATTVQ